MKDIYFLINKRKSSLEAFIRAKYEQKKYIAREWVPPKVAIPKEVCYLSDNVVRFIYIR